MNYTRAQLEALSDLDGSTPDSKLKVKTADQKVWLCRVARGLRKGTYEVIVETKQGVDEWKVILRYPV